MDDQKLNKKTLICYFKEGSTINSIQEYKYFYD